MSWLLVIYLTGVLLMSYSFALDINVSEFKWWQKQVMIIASLLVGIYWPYIIAINGVNKVGVYIEERLISWGIFK